MTTVRVSLQLPYLMQVPNGVYGELSLKTDVRAGNVDGGPGVATTTVFSEFETEEEDADERQNLATRRADQLLRETNRLIQWYRATTRQPLIVELTRAEASPVRLVEVEDGRVGADFVPPLEFEAPLRNPGQAAGEALARHLREAMEGDQVPAVADLFLLDAQEAARSGRFRECVLFS